MKTKQIKKALSPFEKIKQIDENGNEFWSARELAKLLKYSEYRHFKPAIEKAKEACVKSGQNCRDHFEDILEQIDFAKGAKRQFDSVKLSRYGCYLIVQNADSSKAVVAVGQTYFAVQTRLQEIIQTKNYNLLKTETEKRMFLRNELKNHNTQLAIAAQNAGVITSMDYAIFQNHGYMGLYGGLNAKDIHRKKNLKKSQQILDHMGSIELAANLFRATQTEAKLRRERIKGKKKANQTHFDVGRKVRETIEEMGGELPENLPVAESIKELENNKQLKIE